MVRQFKIGTMYCADMSGVDDEEIMWDHANKKFILMNMNMLFLCVSKFVENDNMCVLFLTPSSTLVSILESHKNMTGDAVGDHLFWEKMFE